MVLDSNTKLQYSLEMLGRGSIMLIPESFIWSNDKLHVHWRRQYFYIFPSLERS